MYGAYKSLYKRTKFSLGLNETRNPSSASLSFNLPNPHIIPDNCTQGSTFMFSSVGKEEYGKLFDFVTAKQLRVKNRADQGGPNYQIDDDGGSDGDDDENDAYMERMKAEGRNRDSDMSSDDE